MGIPVTPAEAASTLRRRWVARERAVAAEVDRVRALLPTAATLLRARTGAVRIYLFGSMVWGGAHELSDVDLAIDGGCTTALDAIAIDLEDLLGRRVDVVALERVPPAFAERIRSNGEPL